MNPKGLNHFKIILDIILIAAIIVWIFFGALRSPINGATWVLIGIGGFCAVIRAIFFPPPPDAWSKEKIALARTALVSAGGVMLATALTYANRLHL